jgi:hypothetical protein
MPPRAASSLRCASGTQVDRLFVPSERISNFARLASNLPLNWHKDGWNSLENKLSLVELKRGEESALYDWQGLKVATYSSTKAIILIDVIVFADWSGEEWDGDCTPFDREMHRHFLRAVQASEDVLGAPKFCGDWDDSEFPTYLCKDSSHHVAMWELSQAIFYIQGESSFDELAPWAVSACIEPYVERIITPLLVWSAASENACHPFSRPGGWSQQFPMRQQQSKPGVIT